MLLCSSHRVSLLVRSAQRAGSGGGGKCQAPADLHQRFGVEQGLQAVLFLHYYFSAVCARTACSEMQNAASLCNLTTRAEHLV